MKCMDPSSIIGLNAQIHLRSLSENMTDEVKWERVRVREKFVNASVIKMSGFYELFAYFL